MCASYRLNYSIVIIFSILFLYSVSFPYHKHCFSFPTCFAQMPKHQDSLLQAKKINLTSGEMLEGCYLQMILWGLVNSFCWIWRLKGKFKHNYIWWSNEFLCHAESVVHGTIYLYKKTTGKKGHSRDRLRIRH